MRDRSTPGGSNAEMSNRVSPIQVGPTSSSPLRLNASRKSCSRGSEKYWTRLDSGGTLSGGAFGIPLDGLIEATSNRSTSAAQTLEQQREDTNAILTKDTAN